MQLTTATPHPEIQVYDNKFKIRIYEFTLGGCFIVESQVLELKAKRTGPKKREKLFKTLQIDNVKLTVCKVCYTVKKDIQKVNMSTNVMKEISLKKGSQNHHKHLFLILHNPQHWGISPVGISS